MMGGFMQLPMGDSPNQTFFVYRWVGPHTVTWEDGRTTRRQSFPAGGNKAVAA